MFTPSTTFGVATGQGTIAYEIFQDLPDVDVILVPIGGGGLAAGVSTLAKLLNPNVIVIGVEPEGAASMKASLEATSCGHPPHRQYHRRRRGGQDPGDLVFPMYKNVDRVLSIPDVELVDAFLDVMEKHKMVVENAGLLTVAALKHLDMEGKNVVSVLSGGNMDVITMASLVQHGLINRGRIFTFSVLLPRPARRADAGVRPAGPEQRQYHQAGAQPVRQHQPAERGRAEGHPGGLRPGPQATDPGRAAAERLFGPGRS